jgi:hypothetical protein
MNSNRGISWLEDINFLSSELYDKHKNLFFLKSKDDFFKEIDRLKVDIELLTDNEIKLQIAKIVASVRDAHTSVSLPITRFLPLELYWFSDGIYVTLATSEYNNILYCKITKVNEITIEKVIIILSSIISYENETYLKSQLPKYFPAIELLYDLELVNDIDSIVLTFEDENQKINTLEVKSLPLRECREKLSIIGDDFEINNKLPLYRRNSDKYYWFQYINTYKTVYFKYNACRDMVPTTVITFCSKLMEFIEENDVEKLIIDMRNNFGGNSTLLDPFIEDIKHCPKINKRGKLFVIIGRETFSSALLNAFSLKKNTYSTFLGEPTGGKPNCYGEVKRFTLKNSRLAICYSTEYYKVIEDDTLPSFLPDINISITIKNYENNADPIFEYIINNRDS